MAESEDRSFSDIIQDGDIETIMDMLESDDLDLDEQFEKYNLESPLMLLCNAELNEEDAAAILEIMLMGDPDINLVDQEGRTVLCHACNAGRKYFISRLAKISECDPNQADYYGNTALMFAVHYGDKTVVEAMLFSFSENEVNVLQENNEGITAIMIAEQADLTEIAELLHERAAALMPMTDCTAHDDQQEQTHETDTVDSPIGDKVLNFRHRKLKPARQLAPLVVQNRFQTSKSADYVQYYKDSDAPPIVHPVHRQYSQPAIRAQGHSGYETMYRQYDYETDYQEDDEDSSSSSDENDEEHPGHQNLDEGYGDGEHSPRRRHNSISLPDLRRSKHGSLVATTPHSCISTVETEDGSFCDSGYDGRSQYTITREEISLPDLPEGGTFSEEDYTPRARKDSISLPDLRGHQRGLVTNRDSPQGTPRVIPTEVASTPRYKEPEPKISKGVINTPRYKGTVSKKSAILELRVPDRHSPQNEEYSDDVFERDSPEILTTRLILPQITPMISNDNPCSRFKDTTQASTPRVRRKREKPTKNDKTVELNSPRTVTDMRKKLTHHGQKVLVDQA